jgi:hypothetical protein
LYETAEHARIDFIRLPRQCFHCLNKPPFKPAQVKVFTRDETKGTKKAEIYSFSNGVIPRPFDVAICAFHLRQQYFLKLAQPHLKGFLQFPHAPAFVASNDVYMGAVMGALEDTGYQYIGYAH